MAFYLLLLLRVPPRSKRTDTFFPDTTRFRSRARLPGMGGADGAVVRIAIRAFDLEPPGERQIAEKGNDQFAVGLAHVERFVEFGVLRRTGAVNQLAGKRERIRSEEHTSELPSLMRISYAVFCLKKKN